MKTKKVYRYKPTPEKLNPAWVTTSRVQFWRNNVMIAVISLAEAREMVENGQAYVINDCAIGALDEEGYSIA